MLSELASLREIQALTVVAPILAYVIVDDLRSYRIRNEAVLALLALFVAFYIAQGDFTSLNEHLGFGLALFALFLGMYYFRLMGGGDVKLLAVAFFWIGVQDALLFSILLCVFALSYAAGARLKLLPSRIEKGRLKVPFGPPIALAWISAWLVKAAT